MARIAIIASVGGLAAGCSTDSDRFMGQGGGSPFSNPFASSPSTTGSIQAAPTPMVQSAPLASPITSSQLPPPPAPLYGAPPAQQQTYSPPPPVYSAPPQQEAYATPAPPPVYAAPRAAAPATAGGTRTAPGWTASGGTIVTVRDGESVQSLANRYGVPATAILQANGMPSGSAVRPGQQITIPVYSVRGQASAAPPPMAAPAPKLAALPAAPARVTPKGGVHVIESGDTLSSVSREYGVSASAIASANQMDTDAPLRIGQRLVVPGPGTKLPSSAQIAAAQPAPRAQAPVAAAKPLTATPFATPAAAPVVAKAPTPPAAKPAAPAQTAAAPAAAKPVATQVSYAPVPAQAAAPVVAAPAKAAPSEPAVAAAAASESSFRWPVRGRVISRYGAKPSGGTNEGINVAVPEGTAVKSAEDGTVAYVGNELPGYGNIVLVRHANGYVTAYAHNSEFEVKKGDTVRRGQVIAKSGKTGNVTTPQLHFEIRKGSSSIDPMDKLDAL